MKRLLTSLLLTFALLLLTTGTALAQDATTAPLTGIVEAITLETDPLSGETIAIVSLLDDQGATHSVRLSIETATSLGLVATDPVTGETTVTGDAIGLSVDIDPATVIADSDGGGEKEHPVGSALADFFSETLGVDYQTIIDYHNEGAGFGVIAQALWMTTKMEGDTALFQNILDAKLSGDYSTITLEDGSSPKNWGQFKKGVLKGESKNSLGDVMSGKGNRENEVNAVNEGNHDKQDKGTKDKGSKGSGNGHGHGHGNGNP